ncbi:DUF1707 SHOCT-like domain-containing protein [Nocardioides mesophilus]|uniref:DUF1707 domain-containing protein n=1 Tax=Nocardioides mesophilus TaxID=433659 RepID=A0A7G9RCM6_9ACTN|nr:DUF1707 domain-containing protein [Nocardioides mesophilus]QNN53351.1 DUF1707 domain-containing protein [Nocardioides mesophilus]
MSGWSSPDLRIGDAEREAAISALGEHYAAGRLDKEEYDERAAIAWTARTVSALRPLFADLPAPHPFAPQRTRVAAAAVTAAALQAQSARSAPAPRGFRLPLLPLLLIGLALAIVLGHVGPVLLIMGGLWWMSRSFHRQRRAAQRRSGWGQGHGGWGPGQLSR